MKAIVYENYGPPQVLHLKELPKPTPAANEILVKVFATSVNYGDLIARNFKNIKPSEFHMPGLLKLIAKIDFGWSAPKRKILGSEFSGRVEAVGENVKKFKVGDSVFGYPGQKMGAYAEYITFPENGTVAIKPGNMNFQEAAVIPMGSIMAINLLRKMNIQPGTKVLINGASGSIGSAAVQIAKNLYQAEVTGVCGTPRVEFVKALGADKVIDYTKEDFIETDEQYDLIFDVLGKSSFSKSKKVLSEKGTYLMASFKSGDLIDMLRSKIFGSQKAICALAPGSVQDLNSVKQLIEDGKFKAIIDKQFSLEETAEAHAYVENGAKKGHVVISLSTQENSRESE